MHDSTTPGSISNTDTATHGVASARRILAIDLGKFNSVACDYDPATGKHTFTTIPTRPQDFHDLFVERFADPSGGRLVIEVGSAAGWVKDLAQVLGIEVQVANPSHEAHSGGGVGRTSSAKPIKTMRSSSRSSRRWTNSRRCSFRGPGCVSGVR